MSGGFNSFGDLMGYRLVYGAAARAVEADQMHLRWLDASNPEDVARVRQAVQDELRGALKIVNPAIVAKAIADAMAGQNPKW